MSVSPSQPGDVPPATHSCTQCDSSFASRNKLFRHVRAAHTEVKPSPCDSLDPPKEDTLSFSRPQPSNVMDLAELPPHYVYVVGGRLRGRTLNAVQRFSSVQQKWENCPMGRMIENRGSHGATTVNTELIVVGGGGLHSNLSSCEKFDGENWQRIAALNVSRHALAVASSGNLVYAVGGWIDGSRCSPATEVYDCCDGKNQWINLPSLNIARKLHGCTALHGKLYVFGGSCDEPMWHTDTVEVLDIEALMDSKTLRNVDDESLRSEKEHEHERIIPSTGKRKGIERNSENCHNTELPQQTKEERRAHEGVEDLRRSTTPSYEPYRGDEHHKWRVLPRRLPCRGCGASAVSVGNLIYLFLHGQKGGVCSYDPAIDRYSGVSPLPVEDWHCFDVSVVNVIESGGSSLQSAEIYVIGGTSCGVWSNVAYLFNTRNGLWKKLPSMPQAKRRMACSVMLGS